MYFSFRGLLQAAMPILLVVSSTDLSRWRMVGHWLLSFALNKSLVAVVHWLNCLLPASDRCRTGLKGSWSLLLPLSLFFLFLPTLLLPYPLHISIDAPVVGGRSPSAPLLDLPLVAVARSPLASRSSASPAQGARVGNLP